MLNDSQQRLLDAHRTLDVLAQTSALPFVSGWGTEHPARYERLSAPLTITAVQAFEYTSMGDDQALRESIRRFHARLDGSFPEDGELILSAGSSPLVCSIMALLSTMETAEAYYVRPTYHTFYYMARALGIRLRSVGEATTGAAEAQVVANLPAGKQVLLVTDPVWIAGRSMTAEFWAGVRDWQARTGSLVVVDGTFQYLKWHGQGGEHSSMLDPARTIRLVCPTKSLCVHGARFAYLILPRHLREEMGWIHTKLTGSTTVFDLAVATRLMDQLNSDANNRELAEFLPRRYRDLITLGVVGDRVTEPECTYYVFARAGFDLSGALAMTPAFFELDLPDDYVRVNLLAPDLPVLAPGLLGKTPRVDHGVGHTTRRPPET